MPAKFLNQLKDDETNFKNLLQCSRNPEKSNNMGTAEIVIGLKQKYEIMRWMLSSFTNKEV